MITAKKKAFTLIELLVVIAIIALLLSIVVPSLNMAKSKAQKIICKNGIRQLCLASLLYAEGHAGELPINTGWNTSGGWFWDLSFWSSNRMMEAGGLDQKEFFCPSERNKVPDDARFWQYSRCPSSTNPVSLLDESALTLQEQHASYRVLPYIFLIDKIDVDPASANYKKSVRPTGGTLTNPKYEWVRYANRVRNAGSHEMVVDAVIESLATPTRFDQVAGGAVGKYGIYDSTCHLRRQSFSAGATSLGRMPEGGNVGFVDGHVDWRAKDPDMYRQLNFGQYFWW